MCECLTKVNEYLAAHNTQVTPTIAIKGDSMRFIGVQIATHKIDRQRRGDAQSLTAAFCPFCGEKYEKGDNADV